MKEFTGFKRGVNLGGWLSQCDGNDYSEKHFAEFITEKDFDTIAGWGLDHVRLPFDYNAVMTDDGEFLEAGFRFLDFAVRECEKRGLNIILDLHKTVGFVFDNLEVFDFFDNKHLQDLFVNLWIEMTKRYGNCKNVVFELLNEVTDEKVAEKWNKIAARTIGEIRKLNADIRIIIGGIHNDSIYGLTLLEKPDFDNIVFTFHCYDPLLFTHQSAYWVEDMPSDYSLEYPVSEKKVLEETKRLFGNMYTDGLSDSDAPISSEFFERMFKQACEIAEKNGVPLYCGEYGVIDRANAKYAVNWYKDIHAAFEKMGIARASWNYKQKDYGLIDSHYDEVRAELVKLL